MERSQSYSLLAVVQPTKRNQYSSGLLSQMFLNFSTCFCFDIFICRIYNPVSKKVALNNILLVLVLSIHVLYMYLLRNPAVGQRAWDFVCLWLSDNKMALAYNLRPLISCCSHMFSFETSLVLILHNVLTL